MDTWDLASLDVGRTTRRCSRSDDETRLVAINLPGGEELQEHQTHERAYLVVIDGEMEVVQDGEADRGGAGFLAHFEPNGAARGAGEERRAPAPVPRALAGVGHPSRRGARAATAAR